MNSVSYGAHQDKAYSPRHMVCVPTPTFVLLRRIAEIQGVPMSTAIHVAIRDEFKRLAGDLQFAPAPFSVSPARIAGDFCIRVDHPMFPTLVLRQGEAKVMAATLRAAGQSGARCDFETARGVGAVRIVMGGRCVHLTVNRQSIPLTFPIAIDLGDAIETARTEALQLGDDLPNVDLGAFSKLQPGRARVDNDAVA